MIPDGDQMYSYYKAVLYYWTDRNDIQDSTKNSVSGVLEKKTSNNKAYYEFRADRPIEAEAVQLTLSASGRRISMASLSSTTTTRWRTRSWTFTGIPTM